MDVTILRKGSLMEFGERMQIRSLQTWVIQGRTTMVATTMVSFSPKPWPFFYQVATTMVSFPPKHCRAKGEKERQLVKQGVKEEMRMKKKGQCPLSLSSFQKIRTCQMVLSFGMAEVHCSTVYFYSTLKDYKLCVHLGMLSTSCPMTEPHPGPKSKPVRVSHQ